MNRNHASAAGSAVYQRSRRAVAKAVVAWGAAVFLAAIIWLATRGMPTTGFWRVVTPLALFVSYAILSLLLERCLAHTSLARGWRYRLAFLASAGLSLAYWGAGWLVGATHPAHIQGGADLLATFSGAFAGGLLATSLREGLWENNSPPPAYIQDEVHRLHLQLIGKPGPIPWSKRCFDFTLALFGLLLSLPVWMLIILLVWLEDPGPLLFIKNSVAKGGANFHQFKFRTMIHQAENATGPVLSQENDQRVLALGRILRKSALDELPQLINILRGEMSFVGPRPQRTVLVHGYLQRMPEYAERHRVLPGLAGLAQVAGDYYLTPRQKLRFDRLYIRYISLGFDLKLLLAAFLLTFWFRWSKGWNGRLPRLLLRFGSPRC